MGRFKRPFSIVYVGILPACHFAELLLGVPVIASQAAGQPRSAGD
tara:strand:- start:682 stop:816 length:135 start_codon:yes stop_codon:yes gene_type:complete